MKLENYEEAVRDLEKACKMDKNDRGTNLTCFNQFMQYVIIEAC